MLNFSKYNRIQKILFIEKKLSEWLIVFGNKGPLSSVFVPAYPTAVLLKMAYTQKKEEQNTRKPISNKFVI